VPRKGVNLGLVIARAVMVSVSYCFVVSIRDDEVPNAGGKLTILKWNEKYGIRPPVYTSLSVDYATC
jgi:hypothetical protein